MRIPDIKSIISIAQSDATSAARRTKAVEAKPPQSSAADRVEFSEESRRAADIAASRPDSSVRATEVALLRQQYASGNYQPDTKAIADAMVNEGLFDDLIHGQQPGQA